LSHPTQYSVLRNQYSVLILSLLLAPLTALAQASPEPNPLLLNDAVRAAATAASVVGMYDAAGASSVLLAGQGMAIWDVNAGEPQSKNSSQQDQARVDPDLLGGVEDRAPVRNVAENYNEFQAYHYLLIKAHSTPEPVLARAARHDLTYAHLFEEPAKYRGQIVHLEGRLKRLRRFDATATAARQGVATLYEGWIYDERYYYNPFCVIVSELPSSIGIGEKVEYPVAFDGYFFKRYRYKAGDGWRDAPLLIGRTLHLTEAAAASGDGDVPLPHLLLVAVIGVVGLTLILGFGLLWWFGRGDRQVRSSLDSARRATFFETGEET
jgi:hypothetical protein